MAFALRQLAWDDLAPASKVLRASFDERLPWLAGLHTPEEDRAFFQGHLFGTCRMWGATDGELVGMVAFREGWVEQLYVLPRRQRQGVGAALLGVAKAAWPSLSLWTFQRNVLARRFYEAHGFAAVEQTDGSGNEEREPDVLYRWDNATG